MANAATATDTRRQRTATPERWQAALRRAIADGVQVRQIGSTGQWVATSATDKAMAYLIEATNGIAHGCGCKAGEFDDPVCCHRAAFYHLAGLLDLDDDPEPEPPAPAATAPVPMMDCWNCNGRGTERITGASGAVFVVDCLACKGTGELPDESDRPDVPDPAEPRPGPRPGTVVCPGCGRVAVLVQDKPLPAGWMCHRCRPPAPAPLHPAPGYDLAALLAA